MDALTPEEFVMLKPSQLLTLALHDLELCEQDPDHYGIDMDVFLRFRDREDDKWAKRCYVCLAGSVLAKHFDHKHMHWFKGDDPIAMRIKGIDAVRAGRLEEACNWFKVERPEQMLRVVAAEPYNRANPDPFKRYIWKMVAEFKSFDL